MLVNLYLLKSYSNYFNRKVRKHATLNDYKTAVDNNFFVLTNVNFNPNDGITASHVVGSKLNPYKVNWSPDYVLVINPTDDSIISRWFITEFVRNMTEQYTMSLKRDVCADFYQDVISAPTYIEKATLSDVDPMIVNSEGMQFNQIKAKEYYLKDKTKCPWVIVYLAQKKADGTDRDDWNNIESNYVAVVPGDLPHIEDNPDMSSLFIGAGGVLNLTAERKKITEIKTRYVHIDSGGDTWYNQIIKINRSNRDCSWYKGSIPGVNTLINKPKSFYSESYKRNLEDLDILLNVNDYYDKINSISPFDQFNYNLYSGYPTPQTQKLWFYQNHVYSLSIKVESVDDVYSVVNNSTLNTIIYNGVEMVFKADFSTMYNNPPFFDINAKGIKITYTLTENISNKIYGSIKKNNNHCLDVPYDIIAMPLGQIEIKNHASLPNATSELTAGLNFARTLAVGGKVGDITFGTSAYIYDVQVLPYCPLEGDNIVSSGFIDLTKGTEHGNYELITNASSSPTKIISIMLFASYCSNTFDITKVGDSILSDNEINVSDILKIDDRKIQNECDMYRLVSPNYQGIFDFNVSKTIWPGDTYIDKFNVDIVYRPYNPYIHINPDFGFLYGKDWNDSRGLLCGGDYSITLVSSAWSNYELQNKNYQNIFDRQISHMETERSLQREAEAWGIGTSFLGLGGSIAGGGVGGGMKGGPWGAIAGGIAGGALGGLGIASKFAANDRAERGYQENVSYAKDMFNMQLDNIKALPQSLTKSSSLSYNYKFFPVLEYYTCTNIEKEALRNKLKYNGMTVGRIDTISNYLSTTEERFIKGQVIRLDNLGEDSHLANDIYNEINSGVFFMPEGV